MATLNIPSFGEIEVPVGVFMYVLRCNAHLTCSDNEWSESSDKATFSIINPATGQKLLDCSHASSADVDRAVASARKAFKTSWGNNVPSTERAARESCHDRFSEQLIGAVLFKLADLMERDSKLLGALERCVR